MEENSFIAIIFSIVFCISLFFLTRDENKKNNLKEFFAEIFVLCILGLGVYGFCLAFGNIGIIFFTFVGFMGYIAFLDDKKKKNTEMENRKLAEINAEIIQEKLNKEHIEYESYFNEFMNNKDTQNEFKLQIIKSIDIIPEMWIIYSNIINLLISMLSKIEIKLDYSKISILFYNLLNIARKNDTYDTYLYEIKKELKNILYLMDIYNEMIDSYIDLIFDSKEYINTIFSDLKSGEFTLLKNLTDRFCNDFANNKDNELSDNLSSYENQSLIYLCAYTSILIREITILKFADIMKENTELNLIINNLYNEFDEEEATNKLMPIYNEYYKEVIGETFNELELEFIVRLIRKTKNDINLRDSLESLSNFKLNNNINYNQLLDATKDILKLHGMSYNINDNIKLAEQIYLQLILEYSNSSDLESLILCLFQVNNLNDDIKEFSKSYNLEKDKLRYLKGDFKKEFDLKSQKLEYNNINTGLEFEKYLSDLFSTLGYNVTLTKASGDQGADLIIEKDSIKTAVQAKFYSNSVGNKSVQEVVAAIKFYNTDKGMVVTNNYFTNSAIELAKANNIILIDKDGLDILKNECLNHK